MLGRGTGLAASSLLLALALAPAAAAEPFRTDGGARVHFDVGAILYAVDSYEPRFDLVFTFERALLYELGASGRLFAVSEWRDGHVSAKPGDPDFKVLFTNDVYDFAVHGLPVESAPPAADFVARAHDVIGAVSHDDLDPRDLDLAKALHLDLSELQGIRSRSVAAEIRGTLYALFDAAAVTVSGTTRLGSPELRAEPGKLVLLRAEGARVTVLGEGLLSFVVTPPASASVWGTAEGDTPAGQAGTSQESTVAADQDALDLGTAASVDVALLSNAAPGPSTPSRASGARVVGGASTGTGDAALLPALAAGLAAIGMAYAVPSLRYGLFVLLAPLYARITSRDALGNETRERIYRFIASRPGVTISDVVRSFALGWGATVYHLRVLAETGFVTCTREGRSQHYFVNGGARRDDVRRIAVLHNGNAARVARAVLHKPGIHTSELAAETSLARPTVAWHVQRLEHAGLLEGVSDAEGRKFYPGAQLETLAGAGYV